MEGFFLPAGGWRGGAAGTITSLSVGGWYWSSMNSTVAIGFYLAFTSTVSQVWANDTNKSMGMNIRCVR